MAVRNKNTKSNTRDINSAQRVQLAISLRSQKLSWDEVALRAGYASRGAAHNAVQAELQRCISDNIEIMRQEELIMLDQLHAAIWPLVMSPNDYAEDNEDDDDTGSGKRKKKKKGGVNLWAVDRLIQLSDRRSRLMGLDRKPDEISANMVVVREVIPGYLGSPVEAKSE